MGLWGFCELGEGRVGATWGLTWDVDVHGHDTVTAPHHRVGVVVVAASVGAAGGEGSASRESLSSDPGLRPSSQPPTRTPFQPQAGARRSGKGKTGTQVTGKTVAT